MHCRKSVAVGSQSQNAIQTDPSPNKGKKQTLTTLLFALAMLQPLANRENSQTSSELPKKLRENQVIPPTKKTSKSWIRSKEKNVDFSQLVK